MERPSRLLIRLPRQEAANTLEAELDEAAEEVEEAAGDEEDEEHMSEDDKAVLEELRAAPAIDREELKQGKGRAFFCWENENKTNYFPIAVKENMANRGKSVKCMCLQPASGPGSDGLYTIDPEFNGETGDSKRDYARSNLIFDATLITGEVWREVEGGLEGQRAWRVVKRR